MRRPRGGVRGGQRHDPPRLTTSRARDPSSTKVGDVATRDVKTLTPDSSVDDAIRIVREQNVRRIPVVEDGRPAGIVSIGDLAIERDTDSALADISSEPPNN